MKTHIIKLFFLFSICTFLLSSCLKDDFLNNDYVPQAGFTMINAHSATDYIIHKADNNFIQTMNNPLHFKGINFVYLYPGNRKIQTIDENNNILIDSIYTVKDSTLYTSFVYTKPNEKAGQRLSEDVLLSNLGTNAAFRFLNFAHNQPTVNLSIGDTKVVENRAYDGSTVVADHYKFVSTASGAKKITIKNQANETLAEKDVTLHALMHYSILLIKHSDDNSYEILLHQQYRN